MLARKLFQRSVPVLPFAALLATACARGPEVPLDQPVGYTETTAVRTRPPEPVRPTRPAAPPDAVIVAEPIRRACDLPDEPAEAPRFDFDEAELQPRGQAILARVAACLKEGPLAGARLKLVGHTDPRGTEDYNMQLGLYRAVAAKNFLVAMGIPETDLVATSEGERNASQNDLAWPLDRRVEVHLLEPAGANESPRTNESE